MKAFYIFAVLYCALLSLGDAQTKKPAKPVASSVAASIKPIPSIEFKGLYLGRSATPEDVKNAFGIGTKCQYPLVKMFDCKIDTTIVGAMAQVDLEVPQSGDLSRMSVSFSSSYFDSILPAMIEKYGKPQTNVVLPVVSGMGAKLDSRIVNWTSQDGSQILMQKYARSVSNSSIEFWSKEYIEKVRDHSIKAKSDL